MSIYDDVKNEAGQAPERPYKSLFTTVFGHADGSVIGQFDNTAAAKAAGAVVVESKFDKDGYDAAMQARGDHDAKITAEWMKRLRERHSDTPKAIFDIAYTEAYDRGHSAGYGEVEMYLGDVIDLANKFIAASK